MPRPSSESLLTEYSRHIYVPACVEGERRTPINIRPAQERGCQQGVDDEVFCAVVGGDGKTVYRLRNGDFGLRIWFRGCKFEFRVFSFVFRVSHFVFSSFNCKLSTLYSTSTSTLLPSIS